MQVWNVLYVARCKYRTQKSCQKIAIWAPSHNFVGLYLRNWGTHRQSEKNVLSSNISSTCPRPTSGWDHFVSLGHPSKFQRVLHLGSIIAQQSSSKRQPNFAALNRGRHLCSAGRPSHWVSAHIVVYICLTTVVYLSCLPLTPVLGCINVNSYRVFLSSGALLTAV